jgi:arylsulfatase
MRLTQFYTTPRCCPTRAALMTGLYPHQAGVGGMMEDRGVSGYRGELNRNCITMAEELRRANYHTLMVGKWHLNHVHFNGKKQLDFQSDEPFWENKEGWPLQRGFEEYYGTIHGVCSYYDPFSLVRGNTPIKPESKDFYYTEAISDQAVTNIDKYAGREKPFFLYVAFTAPHWPLHAPEAEIAKYRQRYLAGWDVVRANRYKRQLEMGIVEKSWPLSPRDSRVADWSGVRDKEWEANRMATYAAMVEQMDRGIGRILGKLKEKGIDENTLVVFFSDNGACAEVIEPQWYDIPSRTRGGLPIKVGNRDHSVFAGPEDVWQSYGVPWANVSDTPFLRYKHFTHEGGIATPFIVRWPTRMRSAGGISRQAGHVTDLMATFVEAAGAKHPETFEGHPILPLEGKSLLPVLEGKERQDAGPIFWEHEGNRAVRSGRWKLVAAHGQSWELYDMEADRTESKNLAAEFPERVKEMSGLYEAWAKRCEVLLPERLPSARATVPEKKGGQRSEVGGQRAEKTFNH